LVSGWKAKGFPARDTKVEHRRAKLQDKSRRQPIRKKQNGLMGVAIELGSEGPKQSWARLGAEKKS